jgi:hypothetical protein
LCSHEKEILVHVEHQGGRPSSSENHLVHLEVKQSTHWPEKGKERRCHVCQLNKKIKKVGVFL